MRNWGDVVTAVQVTSPALVAKGYGPQTVAAVLGEALGDVVTTMGYSPDGRRIVIHGFRGETLALCDAATFKEIKRTKTD